MTDKLLFLIDPWFLHFGIAKSIQEKSDNEIYAIIDADDKAQTFFQNQSLVKFDKEWYYLDEVSKLNSKPDITYLKNFEKKYGIDLWAIAYTDRSFYKYNKHHVFSHDEILNIIEKECKFFEKVLEEVNPDFYLTYVPLTHYQELLYEMCKSKGIRVFILGSVRFRNKMILSEVNLQIDDMDKKIKELKNENVTSQLDQYLQNHDAYKQIEDKAKFDFQNNPWQRYKSVLSFFFSRRTRSYNKRYRNWGRTRSKVLLEKLERISKRKYRARFLNKNCVKQLNKNENFIYFPLHYEPERVLLIDAPFYGDQLAVIKNIAKSIPVGYKLYVKEHPMMKTLGWRETSYYKEIINLPNVEFLHPSLRPQEFLKRCSLVITIAGTTGQEAVFYDTPAILLSKQIYSIIPSIQTISSFHDLPNAIKKGLETKASINDAKDFVNLIENNSFEFDHWGTTSDFAYRFGFKGPLMDSIIDENEVVKFFQDHNKTFEKLANEHLRKIETHKGELKKEIH